MQKRSCHFWLLQINSSHGTIDDGAAASRNWVNLPGGFGCVAKPLFPRNYVIVTGSNFGEDRRHHVWYLAKNGTE